MYKWSTNQKGIDAIVRIIYDECIPAEFLQKYLACQKARPTALALPEYNSAVLDLGWTARKSTKTSSLWAIFQGGHDGVHVRQAHLPGRLNSTVQEGRAYSV